MRRGLRMWTGLALVGLALTSWPARAGDEVPRTAAERLRQAIDATAVLLAGSTPLDGSPAVSTEWRTRAESSLDRAQALLEAGQLDQARREELLARAETWLHRATVSIDTVRDLGDGIDGELLDARVEAEEALQRARNRFDVGSYAAAARHAEDAERTLAQAVRP